ncbi:hypothetical protein CAPTEDRAFT_213912 [Capitella teleta]|uniref:CARD domain-containing protein n=1 Tax=Capitella teleta TaxID=283909 RepID=R7U6I8_CAPTE|nr:hypothetical protein CAPTEDRAFT_213912 [Capitella teleta]|eukprot:ELU01609.1 hypothetical protein CAPTEDRAFT_213912 [Capitella teleta]
MEERHKTLLIKNLVKFTNDLDPKDVYDELLEGGVITQEDTERINHLVTRKERVRELLMGVLVRKGPEAFPVFRDALKSKYCHLYDLLTEGMCATDSTLDTVKSEIRDHYKDRLRSIHPMQWLPAKPLTLKDVYVKRALIKINKGEKTKIDIDQLFAPNEDEEPPKRVLVEGDPGIGKSTLCHKLAYEWSQNSCSDQCGGHSFDLVIYLHAEHLQSQQTIEAAIMTHLLSQDCDISSNSLKQVLKTSSVLLIVDAYDEAYKENVLLDQIIEKKRLRNSTLLLTSRKNFLRDKLTYFDCQLFLDVYDEPQQLEHVMKLAKHENFPVAQFDLLLTNEDIRGLYDNPLNLTLLCLLHTEESCSLGSRTELYSAMHELILSKAGSRMKLSIDDMEQQIMRPFYQVVFDAYPKSVIQEEQLKNISCGLERILQVGYLIKDVTISRLQEKTRFRFTHMTFMEFLAAKHLAEVTNQERRTWLQNSLTFAMTTHSSIGLQVRFNANFAPDENVATFLFGLLEGNLEALVQMTTTIMDCTQFSLHNPMFKTNLCNESHKMFRFICELHKLNPGLQDVVIKRCPSKISLGDNCSAKCLKGMVIICSLQNLKPRSIYLDVNHICYYPVNHIILLRELLKCKSIDSIEFEPEDNRQLKHFLEALRIGESDSVQHLKITKFHSYKELPPREIPFGDELRGIHLKGFDKLSTRRYLEAVSKKSLTALTVQDCDLDDRCMQIMSRQMLNHRLENVSLLGNSNHMGRLLSRLAHLPNLRSLEICLTEMNQFESEQFEKILKKNTLQKLAFHNCGFFVDLYKLVSSNFSKMTSLRELEMRDSGDGCYYNFPPMHPILLGIHHLSLQAIRLHYFLRDASLLALTTAIPSWPQLQELHIVHDPSTFTFTRPDDPEQFRYELTEATVQSLIRAITKCHRLKTLLLKGVKIQDGLVPDLCKMTDSLLQLNTFQLLFQYDETLTVDGFESMRAKFVQNRGKLPWTCEHKKLPVKRGN